jgi:aerobic-type carbon monoxide dehydrogenase small subunit (CoxS/CutS family)
MSKHTISLMLNGKARTADVTPRLLLSDFIRHHMAQPGTHVGCEHGVCGACTVTVDGVATRACLMFAVQVDGSSVETIEGLGKVGAMHPLQEAFWEEHGLQCGFCTPGMLMVAKDLLARNPNPTDAQIREVISANLCRCTGYEYIVNAIRSAAAKMRGEPARAAQRTHNAVEAAQ